jgi:protein required for attachment to host cells
MNKSLVAVINGAKARFLTLEPGEFPEYWSSPRLIEHESLLNLTKEIQGQELWSSTKTGRNRGSGGQAHSYDDHRENHIAEFERRFAQAIATQIVNLVQAHQVEQLLLIAEPKILGLMRETLTTGSLTHLKLGELAKDLCQLKPHELHEYLANKGLLPERHPKI